MADPVTHTPIATDDMAEKWAAWMELIENDHSAVNHRINPEVAFTPLTKPLSESMVAFVTTAGAHLDDQEPFHVETVAGDQSHRLIPHDVDRERLRFTHTHYDTSAAEMDHNVVLPLDALDAAVAAGRIASAAEMHIGMMGFNPDPSKIADESAPLVAEILADQGVDAVVLVPG